MEARKMFEELRYKRSEENEEINYLLRLERGYFRITFYLLEEGIAIDTNMEYVIEKDLLQAIIQQAKELGWLEEEKQEIKQETNFEHYEDEIIEVCVEDLAISKGRMTQCCGILCSECGFADENGDCIGHRRIIEWLKKPYQKQTYKLTKFEFDLIQTYRDCHESCKISEFKQLIELKDKGYFKCIDHDTKIQDVLKNCEVIQ